MLRGTPKESEITMTSPLRGNPAVNPSATSLTKGLDKGLFVYAAAASAAGVGALALAQPAEAKIVYTPASVQFTRNLTVNLDLNQDGITDFRIRLNFLVQFSR